jgi:TetR/AcrR family transcriptional regulator
MMPAPRSARRTGSTSARILDAAEAHFARHGYGAASLGDIADAVRIRTPSLYKHFSNKRQLYVAVLERLLSPYFELLDRLLSVPEDAAHAERNLLIVASHYMQTPNLARLVQHAALAGDDELTLLVERWYKPLFRRAAELTPAVPWLESPGGRQQVLAVVVAFHSMMSGYVTMAALHARLTGGEPLGAQAIKTQLELMRHLVSEIWKVRAAPDARDRRTGSAKSKRTSRPRNRKAHA